MASRKENEKNGIDGEVSEEDKMETEEEESASETENSNELPQNKAGETLEFDETAYIMYHQASMGDPCLSFDVLSDQLGNSREKFPLTFYMVTGTQSSHNHDNNLSVVKMSNLHRIKQKENKSKEDNDDEEESSDESEDEDEAPELESASIRHKGSINRIRCTNIENKHLAATWSENGHVYIWDLNKPLEAVDDMQKLSTYVRVGDSPPPIFKFRGHQAEGFAIDWSPTIPGQLATGDCNKNIHLWKMKSGGEWQVDQRPYSSHTASVEDIQWSPSEANVFASCSVDKSIKIWDARVAPTKACMLTCSNAHDADVNVIHWNKNDPFIVSGGDDGIIKIWDLRQFQQGKPCATFKHHKAPITSVEWHPVDNSVFAASGADDMISIWDLAVERDTEGEGSSDENPDIPPQLLFLHQGQTDIKEIHWHPQLPGVMISTALTGFNIFRTISV